ncbi:hypothetical protein J6590_099479 [Homalodisca vitripennis]|nr:hypothetical protein J6590_099479 [Homalodisca vitripennis]
MQSSILTGQDSARRIQFEWRSEEHQFLGQILDSICRARRIQFVWGSEEHQYLSKLLDSICRARRIQFVWGSEEHQYLSKLLDSICRDNVKLYSNWTRLSTTDSICMEIRGASVSQPAIGQHLQRLITTDSICMEIGGASISQQAIRQHLQRLISILTGQDSARRIQFVWRSEERQYLSQLLDSICRGAYPSMKLDLASVKLQSKIELSDLKVV